MPAGGFPIGDVYNSFMARGWESKSVEEQQAAASTQVESKQRLTPEQAARKQQRDAIELSRRRCFSNCSRCRIPVTGKCLKVPWLSSIRSLARLG